MKFLDGVKGKIRHLDGLRRDSLLVREALGRIEARQMAASGAVGLAANEFRVFSQWGEDGILQYLLRNLAVANRVFVEFGVENYQEANTRFLLVNDGWRGLVLDGSSDHIESIRRDAIFWR